MASASSTLHAKIPNRILNLGMTKQELHRTQIPGPAIDQSSFGMPPGMGPQTARDQGRCSQPVSKTVSRIAVSLEGAHALDDQRTDIRQGFSRRLADSRRAPVSSPP